MSEVQRIHPPLAGGGGGGTPTDPTETAQTVFDTDELAITADGVTDVVINDATGPTAITQGGLTGWFVKLNAAGLPTLGTYTVTVYALPARKRQLAQVEFNFTVLDQELSVCLPCPPTGVTFYAGASVGISGPDATATLAVVPYVTVIGVQ